MQFRFPVTFAATSASEATALRDVIAALVSTNGMPVKVGAVQIIGGADARVEVHTDGGCDRGRGGIGAWAWVLTPIDGERSVRSGALTGTTNNRMEMLAVIKALDEIEIGTPVTVYSDSEYVVKGVTVWARQWMKNGWRTRNGQPVKNRDLWQQLLDIYQLHDVRLVHVPGHSGDERNELADMLCTTTMDDASKIVLMGGQIEVDTGSDLQ